MRIVHVANFYGPNSGGIKTTLHELGKGYQRNGHEFIFIVPGINRVTEETPYGTRIFLPSYLLPGSGGYRVIRSNASLIKLIAELKPDRLEVSDRFTMRKLGLWARQNQIPSLVFSHETLRGLVDRFMPKLVPAVIKDRLVNWHNQRLAASFTHVVATTEFAGREFVELGIKNLRQIPLGVDLQCFSPEHRSLKARRELIKGAKYLLVHVGRLSPEKEPQRSIEALRELHHRGIDARLVVVGNGPMWSKLRKQAAGLPVDFLGYVADRKRVASILANADVSIAPGPLETFCLSALESLASGTPTVASEDSAVKEFLALLQKNPAGAIAANNEIAFADAITSLLDRPRLRFVARGIAESLPWDETVRMMLILHGIFEVGDQAPHAHTRKRMRVA